ncbi:MAG: hypothetical protein A3D92_05270 [Bacteroidetes bacterium RIFCSPHIGHO2_02_FULL_44_7]|nr:MAG: hypothetical protein A3D92_05270 [Bacteroidetes bacterium RIFCSPHIGHO2_02_FULL_44_7]
MAEDQNRLEDVMKRLDALVHQQEVFMHEVMALRRELETLKGASAEAVPSSEVPPVLSESKAEDIRAVEEPALSVEDLKWSDQIRLDQIKLAVKEFTEGQTKGGVAFIKFSLEHAGVRYVGLCAANGNWIVQDQAENLIAKGRFSEDGKTALVAQGARQGDVVRGLNITKVLLLAAGLHMATGDLRAEKRETKPATPAPASSQERKVSTPKQSGGLEKFIGENLIAVIAVVILLIGVIFGVKYSIDHNLISPLTRILLSYLLGAGILAVGMRLKAKYELFSATLVSGAMAIMYVSTYVAYSLYQLIPQAGAFALMVIFTVFTVIAAIQYNRQVIAHIGLVGSYAVPFLLSDGSGKVLVLFSYMLLVNAGILAIAFMRNWKPLYYVAFGFTWLIYGLWVMEEYDMSRHYSLALIFGALFFGLFYATFLIYKLLKQEKFASEDGLMFGFNSIIFYGLGYWILDGHPGGRHLLGLFTLAFAVVHFFVSVLLYTKKLADRSLFFLTSAMVLVFLTMAVPVQLDGNWVTMLWSLEAVALFIIGRTQAVRLYEYLSYGVVLLAFFSLGNDWLQVFAYPGADVPNIHPFGHITFYTSLILLVALSLILYVNRLQKYKEAISLVNPELTTFVSAALHVTFILILYNVFRLEMNLYWDQRYAATQVTKSIFQGDLAWPSTHFDDNVLRYKHLWTLNYTLIFLSALALFDQWRIKKVASALTIQWVSVLVVFAFLSFGLYELSGIRDAYLRDNPENLFPLSSSALSMRYISYAFLGLLIFCLARYRKNTELSKALKVTFELCIHATLLWGLCSELINLLTLNGSHAQHKLGLSILCGLYSFFLVGLGILRRKQHLRIAAFSLFGIVLIKLFLYDIAHLTTIAKTIVFISLGLILLVISFLYNKFKDKIAGTDE